MLQPDRRLCKGLRSLNSKVRRSVCYRTGPAKQLIRQLSDHNY